MTRREWLQAAAAAAAVPLARAAAPTSPVAVAQCRTYNPTELVPTMSRLFDQLGGLGRLVRRSGSRLTSRERPRTASGTCRSKTRITRIPT
jgi:hypothetical protein